MKNAGYLMAAVLVLGSASAWAGTTGQLTGIVVGEDQTPLAGVLVSASSPSQIGAVQLATTGEDGSFRFPRLAPGYYAVLVEIVGFVPQRLEQVQVRLDRTTGLQVILRKTDFAAEIEVFETTPVVDPVQTSTGQTYSSDYIRVTSSQFQNLITQTAGASQVWVRVLGSTPGDKAHLLDGMDSTSWYMRAANPAGIDFIFDVAQEVTIHTSNYQAEFGQATGAILNISTKSGGNSFSGTLDARYTDNSFETSGEQYDPDERESQYARIAATLGGPILKDRLWFFGSIGRRETKETGYNAPTTEEEVFDNILAKLTWRANASWAVVGMYTDRQSVEDNWPSSQFVAPEATGIWRDDASIASLSATGMLSPRVLWEIRLGRQIWNFADAPSDGDLLTIGHDNLDLGTSYRNYRNQWYTKSSQNQASTEISWFADAAGAHDFKAGLSLGQPRFSDNGCLNGSGERCARGVEGFFFRDRVNDTDDHIPYLMLVSKADGQLGYGADASAAFVQDIWRIRPNLNLNLGVRWDLVEWKNETGRIADLKKTQPRIGIAWDVFNNGKNMLRASWGRFMNPGTALMARYTNATSYPNEYWLSCSYFGNNAEGCSSLAEARGFGYRSDPESWDPAGWWLHPENVSAVKPGLAIDGLRPGVSEQWLVGFEREVFRRSSVEVSYVNKTSTDDIYSTCSGNYPVPTVDHDCDFWVFANLPGTTYKYKGLLMRFETRALDKLHLLASWTISESEGAMAANLTGGTVDFDYYPYHYVNRFGHLPDHSLHRAKLNGYWLLPYDFSLAFEGWWQSEFRWTPYDPTVPGMPTGTQYVEPRGSGKGGALHQLDLQFAKGFRVGPTRLVALARVFNATNSQSAHEICGSVTGCGVNEFGEAIAWQQPRRYELGFRVEF